MSWRLFRTRPVLVSVKVHHETLAEIRKLGEVKFSARIARGEQIELSEPTGLNFVHSLYEEGWAHFSVRVYRLRNPDRDLTCDLDCVITKTPRFDQREFTNGMASGIRFQPFILAGEKNSHGVSRGRSLFARGFHFPGVVTPGNVTLSCICDDCRRDFRLQSFHAGFSAVSYFYSESGRYTLVVPDSVAGAPPPLGKPDPVALAALEGKLPAAPDGTRFSYFNSLRCPHCDAAYIDFARYPEQRETEYYGNTFFGEPSIPFTEFSD